MFPSIPWLMEIVAQPFKRSQLGLFHGKTKQYGNNVPFSKHKTRRNWLPNVQRKRLTSEALGDVRVKLTARALRTIKKSGGIDNYLLNTRHELLGQEGLRLRLAVRSGLAEKAQQAKATELAARAASGNDANTVSPEDRLATLKARKERRVLRENILKIEDGVAASTLSKDPRPTKQTAREQRIRVGKLLGFGEGVLASAAQTIYYMQMQWKKRPYVSLHGK